MSINGNLCKWNQLIEQLHQQPLNMYAPATIYMCVRARYSAVRYEHCLNPLKIHCNEHGQPFLTGVAFNIVQHSTKMVIAVKYIVVGVVAFVVAKISRIHTLYILQKQVHF